MALSRVVSEIFNVEKCRDLEIGIRGHSRSLKVAPFGRLWWFPISVFSNFIFIYFYLLNSAPVQTEYTRQSHSRTVQPEQGRKG